MPILDKVDPYQYAMYRLYRDGTRYVDGQYIKDLSNLNRDLSKVIIMDSNSQAFSMQPENGVALKPWKGEAGDHGLLDYIPFLDAIVLTNPPDIRPVLESFGDSHIPGEWAKRESDMNGQLRQQWLVEQQSKPLMRNLGSLLRGGPPPTYLEQMRQHIRKTFAQEHEAMKVQQDQMMKDMEMQKKIMKEMKMTVCELMFQVSSVSMIIK
ncbi:HAD-like domain-containing protein [Chlamydoabsidia padenii]|nr:HAD-like domain-containing protein [Chlamydoabsidia padenii]